MKIAFNAGHGANTAGKRSPDGTVREWRVNDKVVDELMKLAVQYEGVQVMRIDDPDGSTDVPLSERVKKANAWGADIYVSVHQNAFGSGWNGTRGTETYSYPGSAKGAALAKTVQAEVVRVAGTKNRGQKTAAFYELKYSKMPAILVECEFMTNQAAADWMKTGSYGGTFAKAIMSGIRKHYGLKAKATPKPTPTTSTKSGSGVHRVIVNGKQVGAFANDANVADQVQKSLASNPKEIRIELVD